MKESLQRAFAYLQSQKVKMGIGQPFATTDFHVEAIDLLSNHVPCKAGVALVVAIYSAIKRAVRLGRAGDPWRPEHSGQHQSGSHPRRALAGRYGQRGAPRVSAAGEQAELSRSVWRHRGTG